MTYPRPGDAVDRLGRGQRERRECPDRDGAREERVERRPQERGETSFSLFALLSPLSSLLLYLLAPALFLAAVESRDQPGQHASDFFELGLEPHMVGIGYQLASAC